MSGNFGVGLGSKAEDEDDEREGPGSVRRLAGDVTGPPYANTVAAVGGRMAADVASATAAVDAATSASTNGTLVKRDGTTGGIAVGPETATSLAVGSPPSAGAQPGQILSPMWNITEVMPYSTLAGASLSSYPRTSNTFHVSGGTLKITASATAFLPLGTAMFPGPGNGTTNSLAIDVVLTGTSPAIPAATIGTLRVWSNELGSHKALDPITIIRKNVSAGTYTVTLQYSTVVSTSTTSDGDDVCQVIVEELPFVPF